MPSLDSINLHTSHRTINTIQYVTRTITVPQKQSKWHIQPQITGGYDIINKSWGITLGIGLGVDL